MVRQVLEFMVKFFGGGGNEPTADKPVTAQSYRDGKTEVSVRKMLNLDYDSQVKKLAEESMKIKAETADLLKQMAKEMEQKAPNG